MKAFNNEKWKMKISDNVEEENLTHSIRQSADTICHWIINEKI